MNKYLTFKIFDFNELTSFYFLKKIKIFDLKGFLYIYPNCSPLITFVKKSDIVLFSFQKELVIPSKEGILEIKENNVILFI
ncbi:MAG: hypothetical protein ACG0KC_02040 [Enterobacteriaceae bacterium]